MENSGSNFASFFKKNQKGPFDSLNKYTEIKKTPNTSTHHQSMDRLMKMDHRKSGKNNLIANSHKKKESKHPLINQFVNSALTVMPNLKLPVMHSVLQVYRINHDPDEQSSYVKSLGNVACRQTGAKIYIKYFPDRDSWTLFKK